MKKILILLVCFILVGCNDKEIKTIIDYNDKVAISYPVTNISEIDDAVTSYVNQIYDAFKNEAKTCKNPELNISYTYKELNDSVLNISLNAYIDTDKKINKLKTFTYDKKTRKFLAMEDLIDDLDALDYDIKKQLLEKYQEADMEYLSNVSYDFFTIDDANLTVYFNPIELNSSKSEFIYLDIPLTSLKLLIDIDKSKNNDSYLNLKKKHIDETDKVVALTFDDGPTKYTDKVLDILKKYDASATFFVVGNKVDFYDETLIRMLREGNEIGNHSYSHKWLTRLSGEAIEDEINKTQMAIKRSTGYTPTLFRPTYGGSNEKLREHVDLTFIFWDVDSNDWKARNTKQIYNNVVPKIKNGSIVLMHDNHDLTVKSLEKIVKQIKDDGYKFVTVSELLKLKELRES